MNSQSEDITEIPKSLYDRGGGSDVTNKTCSTQRDNEQNTIISLENKHNTKHLCCDRFRTGNQFIILPSRHITMLNELRDPCTRASSESICSKYLHKETKYPLHVPDKSKIEAKSNLCEQHITRQKYGNHTKVTFTVSSDQVSEKISDSSQEKFSDKTTYCRPVVNLYNQEFLYKTMVKNAKLRRLVTELVIARKKEKEIENWNNYINDLRRKHNGDPNVKNATSLQYISDECKTLDTIEDIYNTNFTCKQSDPCQSLLQDLYNPHDISAPNYNESRISHEYAQTSRSYNPFKINPLCYPTSSQGRLIILERERMKRLMNRGYKPLFQTINEEKKLESEELKTVNRKGLVCGSKTNYNFRNSRSTNTGLECASTQTEFQDSISSNSTDTLKSKQCNTNHVVYKKKCIKDVRNKETGPETVNYIDTYLRNSSLVSIEEKLDNLIHSINNFISEMKTKSTPHKNFNQHTKLGKRNVSYTRSDICSMARKEKIVCGLIDDSSHTTRNSSIDTLNRIQTIDENLTKINEILSKGIGKNQLITLKGSSIGETYHPCSVQISVTIPTREISTEVTRSLSQAANNDHHKIIIEEIPKSEDSRIAIAVNTDPLSLLAMLRVSTEETIRRILSYVPTIDYYSYLSRLQGPSPVIDSQYVCNICGAAFTEASTLTDHIQKHDLGNTRDCCVCRHVLDLPRRRPGLFKCQYCGQRFTRAYCCELHQEACARQLGKLHDVPSSLMLLK